MRGRWVRVVLIAWCVCFSPGRAGAQPSDDVTRSAARGLGYSGVEAFQRGDFETASDRLEKAYTVLRVPSLGLWSARALVKLGKLVEASGRYLEVTTLEVSGGDVEVQQQSQAEAKAELDALAARIPSLVVRLEGATPSETTVMLGGRPLSTPLVGEQLSLNPGRHVVEARRGKDLQTGEVTLEEGQHETLVLRFAPAPVAPPPAAVAPVAPVAPVVAPPTRDSDSARAGSGQRTVGYALIIGGGAALVFGGVTGAVAAGKWSALKDEGCDDGRCPSEGGPSGSDVDSYNGMRSLSTIGFVAGGVLAAGGAVLLFTAPKERPQQSALSLQLGPGSALLAGKF